MELILKYGPLAFSFAAMVLGAVCLGFVIQIWKDYVAKFKDTTAEVKSLGNEINKMRESPPKVRIPYEARLKAEYEKRGMKWETTTKS